MNRHEVIKLMMLVVMMKCGGISKEVPWNIQFENKQTKTANFVVVWP